MFLMSYESHGMHFSHITKVSFKEDQKKVS